MYQPSVLQRYVRQQVRPVLLPQLPVLLHVKQVRVHILPRAPLQASLRARALLPDSD
jgi:hypothetical protein